MNESKVNKQEELTNSVIENINNNNQYILKI